jgi:hypothetical protein
VGVRLSGDRGLIIVRHDHECCRQRDDRHQRDAEHREDGLVLAAKDDCGVLPGNDLSHDCLLCGEPQCHLEGIVREAGFLATTER